MSGAVVPGLAGVVPVGAPPLVLPVVPAAVIGVVPPEAARGIDPQEWALVQRANNNNNNNNNPVAGKRESFQQRRAASTGSLSRKLTLTTKGLQHSNSSGTLVPKPEALGSPLTPESPENQVQIFEFLKTNCKTEEYVDKIVPNIVAKPRRLKDVPELSRTLTSVPEGFHREKDILEDLGHKSQEDGDEEDEEVARKPPLQMNALLKACPLRYLDETRCTSQPSSRRRLSSWSSLSQRIPLPRHLRHLTVKNLKLSLGKLCRRRTVVITESDPSYKVAYLGNVLTGWAKGEGCAEKPLSTLWKNYTASNKPDVNMKVAVTRSGLKATTREHGLTEYWSHRITHCAAPAAFPRVFCWVYRHEGRKLKQELRCHAVLCAREEQARRMAQQLTERLALALLEFRRDKQCREQARLSLANALHDNPSLPQRKLLLSTGASNYRPPLERSKSAPKLGSIEESAEEDDGLVFGHPRTVARFLRDERLASMRRQRFRESLRRKMSKVAEEVGPEPEEILRHDPRRETLTVVRVNSIEEEPDPEPVCTEERDARLPRLHDDHLQSKRFLLEAEEAEDAAESDEGSSSLQSISSDGSHTAPYSAPSHSASVSHSRTDSGEDFCLGADALKTNARTRQAAGDGLGEPTGDQGSCLCGDGDGDLQWAGRARAAAGLEDDFDDNVSDESGYVEAAPESLVRRGKEHHLHHHHRDSLAKGCVLRSQPCLQV